MPKLKHLHISQEELSELPKLPGVYIMKDETGEVIYVGKAKNIRSRVRSYFNLSDKRPSVKLILGRVRTLETMVTETERQALVLESDLIGKYKPRYNIQLRDDKSHLLVRIDYQHEWPRLSLVRKRRDDGATYVGPFPVSHEARALMGIINRSLPLRTCSDSVIYNRVRPCLEHQIKRCAAPCCLEVDKQEYSKWLQQARSILEGRNKEVLAHLETDMERASIEERYEDAAVIRDRIEVLKGSWIERPSVGYDASSHDAVGFYREEDECEISVLRIRDGRIVESRSFNFPQSYDEDVTVLENFLSQYYQKLGEPTFSDPPKEILLPLAIRDRDLREEVYSENLGRKLVINLPKRGPKARLIRLATTNAEENLASRSAKQNSRQKGLSDLQDKLGLESLPRTIECVDISHFQGAQTVGSVVHFKEGSPEKSRYRKFYLSQEGSPDDFASIAEVVSRHLSRCIDDNTCPDLLVIDGGQGQLGKALEVKKELGAYGTKIIGLAKRRALSLPYKTISKRVHHKPERIYLDDSDIPVVLSPSSDGLHLLEQLRDEAHRFAISFHRESRKRRSFSSALDLVPGIGPKRRMDLLREFGSVAAIRKASPQELSQRAGLPLKLAERVVDTLGKE